MLRIAHNTTVNADSLYYVQTDLCGSRAQSQTGLSYAEMEHSVRSKILGSWERMVDCNRNVIQTSYPVSGKTFPDPWDEQVRWTCEPMPYEYPFGGNGIGWRMSSTNWTQRQNVVDLPFHRGFTGHEHYDRFGIINMNARLYDPVLARFFSPDPQVQSPFSTQGFNRYSYCGNNPVMCTDPDGETTVVGSWLWGFIYGFVTAKDNRLETAWNSANQHALNNIKILCGLFTTNSNYSFWGRAWELASRFTWQAPQTILGWEYAQWCNYDIIHGGIKNIEYYDGATVITNNDSDWGAVTLGSYICGNSSLKADPNNSLFQHEFGHYLQSQKYGLFYLSRYGIPSGFNCIDWLRGDKKHDNHPAEQDANIRAFEYFNKHIDGYIGWDFINNPIKGYDNDLPYNHPQNQVALRNGIMTPAWYNYIIPWETAVTGIINWLSLETYDSK